MSIRHEVCLAVALLTLLPPAVGLRFTTAASEKHQQLSWSDETVSKPYWGPKGCNKMAYIRIQKTGSTTMAEWIMPSLTRLNNQMQLTSNHVEYNVATERAPDCTVTILRDPVERLMSEFHMFRGFLTGAEWPFEQDQWDINILDFGWLNRTKWINETRQAFIEYLSSPANPTVNRQALYILGFDRLKCDKARPVGICNDEAPYGYPARAYNWLAFHDELLAQAKQHLESLRSFAITDCYVPSLRALAKDVGWEPGIVATLATRSHMREQRTSALLMQTAKDFGTGDVALNHLAKSKARNVPWAKMLPANTVDAIRRLNSIDVELVAFAKKLLYERHGIDCSLPAA